MRLELSVEIARPPELEGEPAAGARFREARHLLGRELRTTLEIAEYEPSRLFTIRALDGPVQFTVRHELEPSGGGTLLTVVGEGDAGLLPGFAAGIMARRAEKQFRTDFERLRRILEAQRP
jgi:carbon monoxide dehydrogenase subunit G